MLFCRVGDDQHITSLALVDGSILRTSGRHRLALALPEPVPDLHLDMRGILGSGVVLDHAEAHIAGPGLGATLSVDGVERSIAGERRLAPRLQQSS